MRIDNRLLRKMTSAEIEEIAKLRAEFVRAVGADAERISRRLSEIMRAVEGRAAAARFGRPQQHSVGNASIEE